MCAAILYAGLALGGAAVLGSLAFWASPRHQQFNRARTIMKEEGIKTPSQYDKEARNLTKYSDDSPLSLAYKDIDISKDLIDKEPLYGGKYKKRRKTIKNRRKHNKKKSKKTR